MDAYIEIHIYMCVHTCLYGPETKVRCLLHLLSTFWVEIGFLIEAGAHGLATMTLYWGPGTFLSDSPVLAHMFTHVHYCSQRELVIQMQVLILISSSLPTEPLAVSFLCFMKYASSYGWNQMSVIWALIQTHAQSHPRIFVSVLEIKCRCHKFQASTRPLSHSLSPYVIQNPKFSLSGPKEAILPEILHFSVRRDRWLSVVPSKIAKHMLAPRQAHSAPVALLSSTYFTLSPTLNSEDHGFISLGISFPHPAIFAKCSLLSNNFAFLSWPISLSVLCQHSFVFLPLSPFFLSSHRPVCWPCSLDYSLSLFRPFSDVSDPTFHPLNYIYLVVMPQFIHLGPNPPFIC